MAALTLYDMAKAIDKAMVVEDVRLGPDLGRLDSELRCQDRSDLELDAVTHASPPTNAPNDSQSFGVSTENSPVPAGCQRW